MVLSMFTAISWTIFQEESLHLWNTFSMRMETRGLYSWPMSLVKDSTVSWNSKKICSSKLQRTMAFITTIEDIKHCREAFGLEVRELEDNTIVMYNEEEIPLKKVAQNYDLAKDYLKSRSKEKQISISSIVLLWVDRAEVRPKTSSETIQIIEIIQSNV